MIKLKKKRKISIIRIFKEKAVNIHKYLKPFVKNIIKSMMNKKIQILILNKKIQHRLIIYFKK